MMTKRIARNYKLSILLCGLVALSSPQDTWAKAIGSHRPSSAKRLTNPISNGEWRSGLINEESYLPVPVKAGGMAAYRVLTRLATIGIWDEVMSYTPPCGSAIVFTSSYDNTDAQSPSKRDYSNFGSGWNFNWVAFLRSDEKGNITVNVPGGGTEYYPIFRKNKQETYFKHNIMSHAVLVARTNGFERQLPDGSIEIYSNPGKGGRTYLTEIRDRAGNPARLGYDQWFRITSITDAAGQVSRIHYASEEPSSLGFYRILRVEDPFGREAKFTYSKDFSQLLSSCDPIGIVSKYNYASTRNSVVTSLVTPYGTTRFQNYMPAGSPAGSNGLRITHPDGSISVAEHWTGDRHTTYQWNRIANGLYPNDPQKGIYSHCTVTKWLTDAGTGKELSIKASVKEPLESEIVYSYQGQTPAGFRGISNLPIAVRRKVKIQKPDGQTDTAIQTYSYQYNRFGHVVRKIDPLDRTFSFLYALNDIDLHEVRQTRKGQNVLLAKYEYDRNHNPICLYDASGNATRYEYNKFGQITKSIAADKTVTSQERDGKGRVTAIYGPLSSSSPLEKLTYDKFGHVQSSTDVNGQTVIFEYDSANRITKKLFADGTNETITYDKLDPVTFKDRAGNITKKEYDNFGRTVAIVDPSGRRTSYEWCLCGALRKLTDPSGHSKEWHHDIQGRVIQEKFANGTEIKYEYEPDGHRLLLKTDALNQVTRFSYNTDDTIKERWYENTVNPISSVKYTYDPNYPLPLSAENSLGRVDYRYFPPTGDHSGPGAGRLQSISNSAIPSSTISFEYDSLGRMSMQSINGADNRQSFSYDKHGRLISGKNLLGEFKYQYLENSEREIGTKKLASISYPEGSSVQFDYIEGSNRIRRIRNIGSNRSPLCQFEYLYDQNGYLSKCTEQFADGGKESNTFNHDVDGQLLQASLQHESSNAPISFRYAYDSSFNRILEEIDGRPNSMSFNSTNELIAVSSSKQGDSPYPSKNYSYDKNGNLLTDANRKFKWDAENRLIRIDYPEKDRYSEFSYNALGQLEKDLEVSGGKVVDTRYYIWCDEKICEERNADGTARKRIYNFGESTGGTNTFYFRDQLGSIRFVTSDNKKTNYRLDYDPFGNLTKNDTAASLQYGGYYKHAESGLYLTMYRAYDSLSGRWLSRDPLGELGEAGQAEVPIEEAKEAAVASNLYCYVGNRVMSQSDPLGLQGANAQGQATRQTVSDSGQNTYGRIWYISYAGANQGVTFVNQAPTIQDFTKQPQTTVQQIQLPAAPLGMGLPPSVKGMLGTELVLRFITAKGFGVYVLPGLNVFINPSTGQAWQYIPKGYQVVDGQNRIITLPDSYTGPKNCYTTK